MERPLDSVVLSRMKKFSAMNKLRRAALLVIAKSLSADEINGAGPHVWPCLLAALKTSCLIFFLRALIAVE